MPGDLISPKSPLKRRTADTVGSSCAHEIRRILLSQISHSEAQAGLVGGAGHEVVDGSWTEKSEKCSFSRGGPNM